jgi:hypothetical protein
MAGSPVAAKRANGAAVAPSGYRLRRFFMIGALMASLGLAACRTPPPAIIVPPSAAAEALAPPAPTPTPAEPAATRVPELPVLTGLGPAELIALLGEPDFRRRDPPAELWQYRSADCVLDVFLYGEGGSYRVVRSETRDRHVLPPLIASCTTARHGDAGRL